MSGDAQLDVNTIVKLELLPGKSYVLLVDRTQVGVGSCERLREWAEARTSSRIKVVSVNGDPRKVVLAMEAEI